MKKIHYFLHLPFFLLFSSLLSFLFLLFGQMHEYSIQNHSFHLNISLFMIICLISFLFLLGLWIIYSRMISNVFSLEYSDALSRDFLSYLPLLFFTLIPLATSHYLSSDDLLSRLRLFSLAVFFSIFYLKLANLYHLGKKKPIFYKDFIEKLSSLSLKKKLILLFAAALILYNAGSALMLSGGITFSGDEPHYLLITHSLLNDGDFDLSNNYTNRDYTKYMPPQTHLRPPVSRGTEHRYSYHSPGTSLFLLPFYFLGSFFKNKLMLFIFIIRFGLSIFGALFGLQVFLYALQEWKKEKLALVIWFLFSFTSPVFFYSIHIYPEIIIALFSFTLFRLLRFSKSFSKVSLFTSGFLLSSFIWLHAIKYTFILVPLFIYSLWVLIKKHKVGWNFLYFLAFPICLTFFHTLFTYNLYGSLSPSSVSLRGAMTSQESLAFFKSVITDIPFRYRWETLAGYFLDQRDGLLLYAPIYFFTFLGMIDMARRKSREFFLILFITAPYVLTYAFLTQRAAYSPQARPLVAVSWGMAIFFGYFLACNARKIFSYVFSLASFLSVLFVYILLKNPWFLYQPTIVGQTERAGKLFLLLSNLHFFLPQFLPSFLKIESARWIPNYVWIGILLLFIAAYLVIKKHSFFPKFSVQILFTFLGISVFFIWIVLYPRTVLLYPRKAPFPSGEKITFYSLGQVARMKEPGKFYLPEDGRPYVFYFTSWRKIKRFQIDFGSLEGDYYVELRFFDMALFQGNIVKEIKTLNIPSPLSYKLKNTNFYQISIYLENKSDVHTRENPYAFSILPSR